MDTKYNCKSYKDHRYNSNLIRSINSPIPNLNLYVNDNHTNHTQDYRLRMPKTLIMCLVVGVQKGAPLATRRLTCVDSFITNSGSKTACTNVSVDRERQGPLFSREMARTAASVRGV